MPFWVSECNFHLAASVSPVQMVHAPRGFQEALRVRQGKRAHKPKDFQPKRRCLQHWSLDLVPARLQGENCLCTAIPCSGTKVPFELQITPPADAQRIVGADAAVNGISDLGNLCEIEMSPTGEVSWWIITMRGFQNGTGTLVLNNIAWTQWSPMESVDCCGRVQKLVASMPQMVTDFVFTTPKNRVLEASMNVCCFLSLSQQLGACHVNVGGLTTGWRTNFSFNFFGTSSTHRAGKRRSDACCVVFIPGIRFIGWFNQHFQPLIHWERCLAISDLSQQNAGRNT